MQLVVQKMHLMLKINYYVLGLCKLLAQAPLDMVLLDAQGMGPVSFCFCHSRMVVCQDPLACSYECLSTGGLQLLP